MEFNFLNEFSNYPTLDLLKIVKQPASYQPAAVVAAQQILNSRNISQGEYEEADNYLVSKEHEELKKREKIQTYKSKVINVLEPALIPGEENKVSKWLKILLIILAIQYVRDLYNTLPGIFRYLIRSEHFFDIIILINVGVLGYFPLIFILLLKRKRWGWILLFGDNIISGVLILSEFLIPLYYFKFSSWGSLLWPITVRTLFLIFLLKKEVYGFFHVDKLIIQRTFLVAILIGLFLIAAFQFLF